MAEKPYTRAGAFREVITIEAPPTAQNIIGEVETRGPDVAWTQFCETRASMSNGPGREFQQAYREVAEQYITFCIRYRPELPTTGMRVVHQDVKYEIRAVADVQMARREIEILCRRLDGLDS